MSGAKKHYSGVDLAAARKALALTQAPRLDVDWLAVDASRCLAVFLGDDAIQPPVDADLRGTTKLVETIRASFDGLAGRSVMFAAYRSPAHRAREPVFDLPRASLHEPLHEGRFSGYPHLFVATTDGAAVVRQVMLDHGGREALTRGPYAVIVDDVGPMTYDFLHENSACEGCRALDEPNDPRARSPEVLAAVGFYVYGHTKGSWLRIASPSVAADVNDVGALGGAGVGVVSFAFRFDDQPWLRPDLLPE